MDKAITILVVDDEPDLLDNIGLALEVEAYNVLTAKDGLEALAVLGQMPVNLILADIAMPNLNGYQLYERVRQNPDWTAIPFVFLSARTLDSDIQYGKSLGVDDYLTKPIRAADLLATVQGKLRRAQQLAQAQKPAAFAGALRVGDIKIDPEQYRAWFKTDELHLSVKEFALLECLVRQAGSVLSPPELVRSTHNFEADPVEAGSLLRPLVLALRRKINVDAGQPGYIENVRGIGYRLVAANTFQ